MGLVGRSTVGLILAMNEWFAQGGGIGKFAVALGPSCCRCVFFFSFFFSLFSSLSSRVHVSSISIQLFYFFSAGIKSQLFSIEAVVLVQYIACIHPFFFFNLIYFIPARFHFHQSIQYSPSFLSPLIFTSINLFSTLLV